MISHDRLRELLNYDEHTGLFTRRIAGGKHGHLPVGSVAGHWNRVTGYVDMWLDGRHYLGHRLAYFYVTAKWPEHGVDHKDLNRSNNAWANLRAATQRENMWNMPRQKHNKSGHKGVSKRKDTGKWTARAKQCGRYLSLGCFDTAIEAANAYRAHVERARGDFARA